MERILRLAGKCLFVMGGIIWMYDVIQIAVTGILNERTVLSFLIDVCKQKEYSLLLGGIAWLLPVLVGLIIMMILPSKKLYA